MIVSCPSCGKQLKLPKRIVENITELASGKTLSIKCPQCSGAISLHAGMVSSARTAGKAGRGGPGEAKPAGFVTPPPPPDITWLLEGRYEGKETIEDVPMALILMQEGAAREKVIASLEGIGYRAELVASTTDAIEKIQFVDYACIVLHSQYESNGINTSAFHKQMCALNMSKRRFNFYILIGREFKTLYNLQALVYSANLVVNDQEIPKFDIILRKAIPEYEDLFGPIMEELRHHGR